MCRHAVYEVQCSAKVLSPPPHFFVLLAKWEIQKLKHVQTYIEIQYTRQNSLYSLNLLEGKYVF